MDSTSVPTPDEKVLHHPGLNELDELCINTIRTLTMDAVQKAKSGHPGMPMGMAPAAYILWTRHLQYNPRNPKWVNRDRFVLSAGHGCMLLYSLLHLTGYDLSLDDLKNFRQWGSKTPGHPEYGHTPGVEVTTGPARAGDLQRRRHGDRGEVSGGILQPGAECRSSTTRSTSLPGTATCRKASPRRLLLSPAISG